MGNVVVFESFNGGKQADERVLELFGAADVQFGFAALENFAVGDFIDESQIARFFGQPGNNAEFDKFHQTAAFDGFDIRENGRSAGRWRCCKAGQKRPRLVSMRSMTRKALAPLLSSQGSGWA